MKIIEKTTLSRSTVSAAETLWSTDLLYNYIAIIHFMIILSNITKIHDIIPIIIIYFQKLYSNN